MRWGVVNGKVGTAASSVIAGLAACVLLACSRPEREGVLRVGVAGNFAGVAREIATRFEAATGHTVELSIGATGQLYAQIVHGAPLHILLAADAARPRRLVESGHAVSGSRFTYAIGRLVALASPGRPATRDISSTIASWATIAIANPTTAPYGRAATQVFVRTGLDGEVRGRIVTATGVAQAFQFVASGSVDGGLVALAQAMALDSGRYLLVPDSFHDPIRQDAVLLRVAATHPAALAWMRFLRSAEVRALIVARGYGVASTE